MKSIWREIVLSVIMGMILPGILLNWAVEEELPAVQVPQDTETLPREQEHISVALPVKVRQEDGTVAQMDMDSYLTGVILAEMPSTFGMEAKKAQAVAARTFAWKAYVTGGKHGDGSVCGNPGCCQAYISEADFLKKGGTQNALEEAKEATAATSGYVLVYEGELIEATYFSCSGGSTEDAVAVWGTDFPYLRATDSPGEEYAVHYTDTAILSKEELEKKLNIRLSGDPAGWVGFTTYTAGGGVNTIEFGGRTFTGPEIRSLLGLRSTAFTVTSESQGLLFTTKGFGHRVGMSQYGADAMDAAGSTWQEILLHYYQGTTLELTNPHG